jgi:hypothetical protein
MTLTTIAVLPGPLGFVGLGLVALLVIEWRERWSAFDCDEEVAGAVLA